MDLLPSNGNNSEITEYKDRKYPKFKLSSIFRFLFEELKIIIFVCIVYLIIIYRKTLLGIISIPSDIISLILLGLTIVVGGIIIKLIINLVKWIISSIIKLLKFIFVPRKYR